MTLYFELNLNGNIYFFQLRHNENLVFTVAGKNGEKSMEKKMKIFEDEYLTFDEFTNIMNKKIEEDFHIKSWVGRRCAKN